MATGLFNLKQVNQAISQGAWSGHIAPKWVEYLVVAGGGGGGYNLAGGGGASGVLSGIVTVAAGTSYTVTVGSGGAGGSSTVGTNGQNSVFGAISATGGGGGAGPYNGSNSGVAGGSGGGGVYSGSIGAGTSGQGNAGGSGNQTNYCGGGGGGAGTVGLNAQANPAGNGGAGIASAITGTVVAYAGGGGGACHDGASATLGIGGVGGGGNGGKSSGTTRTSGTANTGGGGGGGEYATTGGSGGSGIVVVRYPGSIQFFTGGTLSYANGYMIHTFYASGTLASTTPTPYVTDYQISRSLRFNSADSAYLNRTPASATNQKTWTWSAWVKRGTISSLQTLFGTWSANTDAAAFAIYFNSGDTLNVLPWTNTIFTSTAVFRDPSAWYHIVVAFDSTQATASNRIVVYVNGVNQAGTYPLAVTQGANYAINSAQSHRLGDFPASGFNTFGGYMTEVNFIDGQALTPSSFGYTNPSTGVWSPLAFVGTYGTNGFYLNFSDNSNTTAATLGKDYSGNGNNWTPNNFSVTAGAGNDSLVDSPTSYGTDTGVGGTVRGNYATLNPLQLAPSMLMSNGNLYLLNDNSAEHYGSAPSTIAVQGGKWYAEFTAIAVAGTPLWVFGICRATWNPAKTDAGGWYGRWYYTSEGYAYRSGGTFITNNTASGTPASYGANDVIGVAIDLDAQTISFYKNGVSQGTPFTSIPLGVDYMFAGGAFTNNTKTIIGAFFANFGQRPFAYTAPSGYKALCTQNLPTPTIGATSTTLATSYFNPVTYTGLGATQTVTVGFQPDFTWIKNRTLGANWHVLTDSVRGVQKEIYTNSTAAEATLTTSGVNQFNAGGFQILGNTNDYNGSTSNYVAWNWKANGSGSTNTAGSITSTVSANTTSGFSIITWTGNATQGATIGHGLGAVPALLIFKNRSVSATEWPVKSNQLSTNSYLYLNATNASASYSFFWSAEPTSSLIYLGSDNRTNGSGNSMVCYAFAEVAGYSKFGSYTGNGSTDGPFVYTGFRPRYILWKRTDSSAGGDWGIVDTARNPSNVVGEYLAADLSSAGATYSMLDILSNGFKPRWNDTSNNASGGTYIFAAFAESPFKYSLAR